MADHAFALRESVDKETFAGASIIGPPDGTVYDIKALLGDDGVIVVSEEPVAEALSRHPALKSVPAPARKLKAPARPVDNNRSGD